MSHLAGAIMSAVCGLFPGPLDGLLFACLLLYAVGVAWFISGMGRPRALSSAQHSVSVVVAARDEARNIGRCIASLLAQDYPADKIEIIVVDDGSRDGTATLARQAGGERIQVLAAEASEGAVGSKKAALSRGVAAAGNELILTTDADCVVPVTWVRSMVACFGEDVGLVAGFSQIGTCGSIRGWRQGYEATDFLVLMGCIAGSTGRGHPMAASGQNLGYRRQVFAEVGGYRGLMHRASGDDVLLLQRVRRQGHWRVGFAQEREVRVVHPPAASLDELVQKRTRWASNASLQWRLDPLFFAYMANTFVLCWLLVSGPLLLWMELLSPAAVLGAWGAKVLLDGGMLRQCMVRFERRDLGRYFLLWALLQPLHIALVGVLGCLGIFRWKGAAHRWGRSLPAVGDQRA